MELVLDSEYILTNQKVALLDLTLSFFQYREGNDYDGLTENEVRRITEQLLYIEQGLGYIWIDWDKVHNPKTAVRELYDKHRERENLNRILSECTSTGSPVSSALLDMTSFSDGSEGITFSKLESSDREIIELIDECLSASEIISPYFIPFYSEFDPGRFNTVLSELNIDQSQVISSSENMDKTELCVLTNHLFFLRWCQGSLRREAFSQFIKAYYK